MESDYMKNTYETDRLILKVIDKSDAPLVVDYYLRNQSFLEEWVPVRDKEFYSLQNQEELIQQDRLKIEANQLLKFWMFCKHHPDRIIGSISFDSIVRGAFLSCYLGYKLDKDEVGHGYMTEALGKGIDLIFGEWGLHRIEANIMPKNQRSLRVVEKLGFYNEGLARKYLKINGEWEDHIHMVLLNDKV